MPLFLFQFSAVPSPQSPRAADIAGGHITVFVKANDGDLAEVIARAHVMGYAWQITEVLEARGPVPAHLFESDIPTSALLRQAERNGLASEFVAWPKQERPATSPVELRSLGPPLASSKNQH